jgi:AraC-like DNA-binding protein
MRGHARLFNGDEIFELREGDCAVINGNEIHQGAGGGCDYMCVIIPPAFLENIHVIINKIVHDDTVIRLMEAIKQDFLVGDKADMLAIRGYTCLAMSHLVKNYTVLTLNEKMHSSYFKKRNMINGAVQYINENYDKPLSTSALAEKKHLSEGYFCRVFKEVTGKSTMEYLNHVRIDKAEKMLKKTKMTVTEIAFCCGFEDANCFSRTFKKIKGETPQSVRMSGVTE